MKHIRTALAAALVTLGGAAALAAQQPQTQQAQAQAHHGKHAWRGRRLKGQLGKQLMKGMTLTDAEKANIKSVHAKYAPQMKALRQQFKPQVQAARAARQKGDTAAVKNLWQQTSAQRAQTAKLLEAERGDLRNALSPANQLKFDANVKQFETRAAARAQKFRKKLQSGQTTQGTQG